MTIAKNHTITRTQICYGEYTDSLKLSRHYDMLKKHFRRKIEKGEKLRVAFYVLFDSIFPGKSLYKLMLKDELFEPFIVVIPNTTKDFEYLLEQMESNYLSLSKEFDSVYSGYTSESGMIDFSDKADLICFSNPYDHITDEFYTMKYSITKAVLPFVMSYGFFSDMYAINYIFDLALHNSAWKVFLDTKEHLLNFLKFTLRKGENAVLTGYGKMDSLVEYSPKPRTRKKIIIAPHHTVGNSSFPLSNFLEYAHFFLELPLLFTDVDFVFRPHPLLFLNLFTQNLWSQDEVDRYIKKMSNYPNVEYQAGGDYFDTFVQSDALIHDCSSFLLEYLYTDKPTCFMVKNKDTLAEIYTPFGLEALAQHEFAYSKNDIIEFINNTVIGGIDRKKEQRGIFAQEDLKINFPHASAKILEHIKEELGQK